MNVEKLQVPIMLVLTLVGGIAGWGFSQALSKVEQKIADQQTLLETKLETQRVVAELRIHNIEEHVVWRGQ